MKTDPADPEDSRDAYGAVVADESRHDHDFYGIIAIHADRVFLCDATGNELSLSVLDGVRRFEGKPVRIRGIASDSKLLAWSIERTYD